MAFGRGKDRMYGDTTKPTILAVDDSATDRSLIEAGLAEEYNVITASNGIEALEKLEEETPDLVLLDILMPGMNGYEVYERMKEDEWTAGIPVILVTSKTSEEDEIKGLDLGVNDYITKPYNLRILKARIKTQLEIKRQHDILGM